MTYEECINFIICRPVGAKDINLNTMRFLMQNLDNPQDDLKFIHIAGTNGKGSVTLTLASLLKKSGYKVGVNTSPYIIDFRERLQINGEYIEEEDVCRFMSKIKPIVLSMEKQGFDVCSFAIITALGFLFFKDKSCDIVCLETGLGGTFDPTNIIKDVVCSVIMSISLDHIDVLGDDIRNIAYEKCGIIKENSTVFVYPIQDKSVYSVIKKQVKEKNAKFFMPSLDNLKFDNFVIMGENKFIYKDKEYGIKNLGKYIVYNIVMVIEVANFLNSCGFYISDKNIKNGLSCVSLYCRMELISLEPLVILDGAHNIGGITSICDFFDMCKGYTKVAFCAFSQNRDIQPQILRLTKTFDKIYMVNFSHPKSMDKVKVLENIKNLGLNIAFLEIDDIAPFLLDKTLNKINVFCGSLYFVSQIRAWLKNKNYINL